MGRKKINCLSKFNNTTCLNRMLGKCPNCERDYDTTHHPNNLDCPKYKSVGMRFFNVK